MSQILNIKFIAFLVSVIFIFSILTTPVNIALAQTENEENKNLRTKAEFLLGILERNKAYINETLQELKESNVTIPEEALTLYHEGILIAENATIFYNQTKYREACKAAIEAMKKFRLTLQKLQVKETKEESEALHAIGLYTAINRTERFLDKLELLLAKANETIVELGLDYSLTSIEEGIREAREHLVNATAFLDAGNVTEAAKEIGKAHHVVAGYMGILHPIVNAHKVKRAEKFVNKTISRLEKLKSRLNSLLINASPVAKMAVTLAIQKAHNHILKVKKMLTGLLVKRFNLLVDELLNVKKEEEVAIFLFSKEKPKVAHLFRDVEKTEKEIQALQSSLISLGIDASNLNLTIQEAKNLLSQAMVFLGEGKKEEAKKLIEQAKEKMSEVREKAKEKVKELTAGKKEEKREEKKGKTLEKKEERGKSEEAKEKHGGSQHGKGGQGRGKGKS